jgi:hypothetical protein
VRRRRGKASCKRRLKYSTWCYIIDVWITPAGEASGLRIFKTKWFVRFARKQGIGDADLRAAVDRALSGLIDADLGGGVIKQRIARPSEGKSGGFRSIVLLRAGEKAFSCTAFQRARAAMSARMSWRASGNWPMRC